MNSVSTELNSKSVCERNFGISQGRLTVPPKGELQWFPQEAWREEFVNGGLLGLSFIELLIERQYNPLNPVWSNDGITQIQRLCMENNLITYSVCLDYIIDHSITDDAQSSTNQHIYSCFEVASKLGCKVVVLPLLEESDLTPEKFDLIAKKITEISVLAKELDITICVESLLNAEDLISFVDVVDEENVKVVFDTGNRILATPNLSEEIIKLGDRIAHVHIKDKDKYGDNVILGTGLVNFVDVFKTLDTIQYQGPLVFETNRGLIPIETARFNITLCNFFITNAG